MRRVLLALSVSVIAVVIGDGVDLEVARMAVRKAAIELGCRKPLEPSDIRPGTPNVTVIFDPKTKTWELLARCEWEGP